MTTARRTLAGRLASRGAFIAAVVALNELGARAIAGWNVGDRLLAGGTGTLGAAGVLGAFLLFRLAVFFVLPPAAAIMVARAIAEQRRAR